MAEVLSISERVLDTLVESGYLTNDQLVVARDAASGEGRPVGSVLLERGLVTPEDLASTLEDEMGVPRVDLASYVPEESALSLLPADIARERRILPLFEIEGMLTVAIGDAADVFGLDDVSSSIGLEVEPVLADAASVLEAVVQHYADAGEPAPAPPVAEAEVPAGVSTVDVPPAPIGVVDEAGPDEVPPPPPSVEEILAAAEADSQVVDSTPATVAVEVPEPVELPGGGTGADVVSTEDLADSEAAEIADVADVAEEPEEPERARGIAEVVEAAPSGGEVEIDLDVLAVADAGKTAVLVTQILELAVRRGASRIQLLPYKSDFFLVLRVAGALEKVASAPLSMQSALVDGFKNFARQGSVPPSLPVLGRVHAKVLDKDVVLTVSVVPTISGQRMVVSIGPGQPVPRAIADLGMTEAEARAVGAMVERGRGILLVCSPVDGGRSATYYAALSHAAAVGKTVYSVERSIDYEIPAVAQVLVGPGAAVGAASYFASGMRQDTDVLAIDGLQSVEEAHLAVEVAGMGKLVLATFVAGDIMWGVRRMLDMGTEPTSLAATLTLAVGQRRVRLNCTGCSAEGRDPLAESIPGAPKGLKGTSGAGCDRCRQTGFSGSTGVFEVLPFTESLRAKVAANASLSELAGCAREAGMRPLIASGLAKVEEGIVSPAELDRVLRFSS